jgi:hypothetical protein
MKTRLLAFAFFSFLFISGLLGSCTKTNSKDNLGLGDPKPIGTTPTDTTSNGTGKKDTTGIGTFHKTWLDGTWRMVKEIEMPDHGYDTIIRTKGCEFLWLETFNRGGYSTKPGPNAAKWGCSLTGGTRWRYTLSADNDSNRVFLFRIGSDKAAGEMNFTSHTDSTYFVANRGGNIWTDRFYVKQK